MVSTLLKTLGLYASLVPLILGIFTFSKNSKAICYLILLSVIACATEFMAAYLAHQKSPNLFLFHLYPPIEFSILLVIYSLYLRKIVPTSIFWAVGILFILFSVINTLFFQPFHVFNTNGRGLESFLILGMAIGYTILQLYMPSEERTRSRSMFWVNTGIMMYFSINMIFFFMSNYLIENFSQGFNAFIWDFHALVSIALYLIFTFAIYLDWKKAK